MDSEKAVRDETLKDQVIAELHYIFDPEIPVNIYDLGLIYGVEADEKTGRVDVRMTLTAPACPVAGSLPEIVADAVRTVDGVSDVGVELVWDPPWTVEMMSEAARLQLGMI